MPVTLEPGRIDLQRVILERFGIAYHERTIGKLLQALGFSHISARPRHPAQDPRTIEAFGRGREGPAARARAAAVVPALPVKRSRKSSGSQGYLKVPSKSFPRAGGMLQLECDATGAYALRQPHWRGWVFKTADLPS
jgi:hypothetical protein